MHIDPSYTVPTHMSEKAASHHGRVPLAGLQLWQEVVAVEVIKLLQVAEDDASFAPQVLGDVWSVRQGEVVGQDVAQGADILPFCVHQLFQDTLQPPSDKEATNTFKDRLLPSILQYINTFQYDI